MDLAICTIQRDRGRWLHEWVAFHYAVGFRKFYIFLHRCSDNSNTVVAQLSKHFDISAFVIPDDTFRPQLAAYQYCYQNHGNQHDWIAFIDGDEFLFSPNQVSITPEIEKFQHLPISALGVYWACFGSSGHMLEPTGLITENYRYRAPNDIPENGHFKSIVKGHQGQFFSILNNAHFFRTEHGTYDTLLRELRHGQMEHAPCHDKLRINHYVTQSLQYFREFKQNSGSADAGSNTIRPDEWWERHNRNDVFDDSLKHIKSILKQTIAQTS